jgi:hypothetical protein
MFRKTQTKSLTVKNPAVEPKGAAWHWARRPSEAEPGEVVIGTAAGLSRRYRAALTDAGILLAWSDGMDRRAYRVERDWAGKWACSCPAFEHGQGRKCKHVSCIANLYDAEGW